MDALSIRARGKRAPPKSKSGAPFNIGASIGLASTGRPGEFKLNGDQMAALEALYTSSPAIVAARSVLRGQLFGGGIVLRRGGEEVKLKAEFQRYLSSKWLAFAGDVLDSLLKWGLCVVVYDEDVDLKRRASKVAARGVKPDPVLAPLVPPRETIEIAYRQGGLMGYTRQYVCFNMTSPQHATRVDEDARVFIREQPDEVGNVVSPMSKCFELGSFVTALTELALTSEITNARPRMWTQMAKAEKGQGVESNQLFFDRFVAHLSHSVLRQTHPFILVCCAANRARCSRTSTRRATPSRPRRWRCSRSSSRSSTGSSSGSRTTTASTTCATPLGARASQAASTRTSRRKFRLRSSAYPRCVFYSNLRSAAPTHTRIHPLLFFAVGDASVPSFGPTLKINRVAQKIINFVRLLAIVFAKHWAKIGSRPTPLDVLGVVVVVPDQCNCMFQVPHGSVIVHRHFSGKLAFEMRANRWQIWKLRIANHGGGLMQCAFQRRVHPHAYVPCKTLSWIISEPLCSFLSLDFTVSLSVFCFCPCLPPCFALLRLLVLCVVSLHVRFAGGSVRPFLVAFSLCLRDTTLEMERFALCRLVPFRLV